MLEAVIFVTIFICQDILSDFRDAEYELIYNDEIPLVGSRYIRANDAEGDSDTLANGTRLTNNAPENPFSGITDENDLTWVEDALKNIAYYLRAHKFNEFDRRYEVNETKASKEFYKGFPRPPLRSLHWEVHKFCEPSFLTCIEYLRKRLRGAGLRRQDDTSIVIQEQQWSKDNHSQQIDTVESECRKMQKIDNIRADPFDGPIERFQWRVTASYYMCWYTMNGVPNLAHLNENCDNFAACLDPVHGVNNKDPRADDSNEYACALYSFCPDLCCTQKHIKNLADCWEQTINPCYAENSPGQRQCYFHRTNNTEFRDIILNRWNVSCACPQKGYQWDSQYGICVDIDECLSATHKCDENTEACVNLQGSFECACQWGYSWNGAKCEASSALKLIKLYQIKSENATKPKMASSIVKRIFYLLRNISNKHTNASFKLRYDYFNYFITFINILLYFKM